MSSNISSRELLVEHLKTQKVVIPDLKQIFEDWPGTYHTIYPAEQLSQLRVDVKDKLHRYEDYA